MRAAGLRPAVAGLSAVLSGRRLCTAPGAAPHAVRVHLLKQDKALEVTFQDGRTFRWWPGAATWASWQLSLSGTTFDDLHGTGIFTWPFLYELGAHKFARMRRYVRALRARALSREPAARCSAAGGGVPGAATA